LLWQLARTLERMNSTSLLLLSNFIEKQSLCESQLTCKSRTTGQYTL
jgi:hypothetical protein